jgi:hypothetical protein
VEVLFAVERGADSLEECATHFSAADESEFEQGGSFGWEGASCKLGATRGVTRSGDGYFRGSRGA